MVIAIAFSGTQNSGAEPLKPAGLSKAPEHHCTAHKAVKFYATRIAHWRRKMGAGQPDGSPVRKEPPGGSHPDNWRTKHPAQSCPRHLAHVLQRKAYGLRKAYHRYIEYHYAWWKWLPDKWQRIGACETGYGKRPGQWTWNSGTYQGAFGFYTGTWDQYKPRGAPSEAYLATPRQQYQAALNVAAVHGYGAWGCGGA